MTTVLNIPFQLDLDRLMEKQKIRPGRGAAHEFTELVESVQAVACPKVLFTTAYVQERGENTVTINGQTFVSSAMRANLAEVERVFPYICTCGTEVDAIPLEPGDFVRKAWLYYLKLELLSFCHPVLMRVLKEQYQVEKLASMNPGSGDASLWPIQQQTGLFALFGDVQSLVGVRLTESYLMVPEASVSGILFETAHDYQNCQLCQRENCPNRRALFDPVLWDAMQMQGHDGAHPSF